MEAGDFAAALATIDMHAPSAPVFSCASARPFVAPAFELAEALVSPVRWRQTMTALAGVGAGAFLDPGPGKVLAKLAPRCVPDARVVSLDDADTALACAA